MPEGLVSPSISLLDPIRSALSPHVGWSPFQGKGSFTPHSLKYATGYFDSSHRVPVRQSFVSLRERIVVLSRIAARGPRRSGGPAISEHRPRF